MSATPASLKLIMCGDSGVGKSSLMVRFTSDTFSEDISATIGLDFRVKELTVDGPDGRPVQLKLTLLDTAGQERFRTIVGSYYRNAAAVILVYDVSSRASFDHLQHWLDEARTYCGEQRPVQFLLIGNKIDLGGGAPEVAAAEGAAFARTNRMLFAQCSAKTREGVAHAFEDVARAAFLAGGSGDGEGGPHGRRGVDLRAARDAPAPGAGYCGC